MDEATATALRSELMTQCEIVTATAKRITGATVPMPELSNDKDALADIETLRGHLAMLHAKLGQGGINRGMAPTTPKATRTGKSLDALVAEHHAARINAQNARAKRIAAFRAQGMNLDQAIQAASVANQ